MHALLLLLLIPFLLVLLFLLGLGIFAYAKLAGLWYRLTGRQPQNHFRSTWSTGTDSTGGSYHSTNANRQSTNQSSNGNSQSSTGKKIFSDNEGEYVDFEVID